MIEVKFPSSGLGLSANLFLPPEESTEPRPAIVVGHPGSGVKEQTAGLYAQRLAESGFITLAFDAAYQGASEGEPHGLEDPTQRIEDFKAAVSYLTTREDVDPNRIGAVGICASGGYGLAAFATDHRIKALGTVSAVDMGRQWKVGADGTQNPSAFQGLLDKAAEARTAEAHGDSPQSFEIFPETMEEARRLGGQHGAEGFEYYRTPRGEHPRARASLPWISLDRIGLFDAFSFVDKIGDRPLMMAVGTRAVTGWMSVVAYENVTGPKELMWIEGASHVDLYDKEEYVAQIVERMTAFFTDNLAAIKV